MNNSFKSGFEYVAQNLGGITGEEISQAWIGDINAEINAVSDDLIKTAIQKNSDVGQLQGFIAETWHEHTFNTNAAIHHSTSQAIRPDVNTLGSVDIEIRDSQSGEIIRDFSLKSYNSPESVVRAQSETPWERYNKLKNSAERKGREYKSFDEFLEKEHLKNDDTAKKSLYYNQGKTISTEQLESAKEILRRKIERYEAKGDKIQVARYQEVLDTITDVVQDDKGEKSLTLTHSQAIELAKAAKNGHIDEELLKQCGLDINQLVTDEDIAKEALSAGLNAAVITFVINAVPLIVDVISMLTFEGEINPELVSKDGVKALSGTARGFLNGAITAALVCGCETGKLGEEFIGINPKAISALVVLSIGTINTALKCAFGKIDKTEMAKELMQMYIVTASSYLGGYAMTILLKSLPMAFMLGSFVGGIVGGFIYKGVDHLLMSYCVESGCTFFGLVEQDYTLPEETIKELGLDKITFDKLEINEFNYNEFTVNQFDFNRYDYSTIGIQVLRRDLIGISTVGYVS